jgi:L-fuconolactonase
VAVRPVWGQLLAWFGPARLLWGSDWPVLNLAGDYPGWVTACQTLSAGLSADEQAGVWGDNACRFYGLGAPGRLP